MQLSALSSTSLRTSTHTIRPLPSRCRRVSHRLTPPASVATSFIHKNDISLGDLHTGNLLLTKDPSDSDEHILKVCNFGKAVKLSSTFDARKKDLPQFGVTVLALVSGDGYPVGSGDAGRHHSAQFGTFRNTFAISRATKSAVSLPHCDADIWLCAPAPSEFRKDVGKLLRKLTVDCLRW